MKRTLLLILTTILLVSSLLMPGVSFAASNQTTGNEVDLAQKAGQAWLDRIAQRNHEPLEWLGALLTQPQVCYDLKGKPNAYMFAIENNGIVGHIIVGSSAYGFPIFEAGEAAPSSIPSATEV